MLQNCSLISRKGSDRSPSAAGGAPGPVQWRPIPRGSGRPPSRERPDPPDTRDGGLVARALATIDVNGLAGHEARRFQIQDRADDL